MRQEHIFPAVKSDLAALAAAARLAVVQEQEATENGTLTRSIMDRRDAAIRVYHLALDPWSPCRCYTCEVE